MASSCAVRSPRVCTCTARSRSRRRATRATRSPTTRTRAERGAPGRLPVPLPRGLRARCASAFARTRRRCVASHVSATNWFRPQQYFDASPWRGDLAHGRRRCADEPSGAPARRADQHRRHAVPRARRGCAPALHDAEVEDDAFARARVGRTARAACSSRRSTRPAGRRTLRVRGGARARWRSSTATTCASARHDDVRRAASTTCRDGVPASDDGVGSSRGAARAAASEFDMMLRRAPRVRARGSRGPSPGRRRASGHEERRARERRSTSRP